MKKSLAVFLLGIIILPACMTLEELKVIPPEESFYGIDFRPYTEKGFFMTPEKFVGEYEPIGLLTYQLLPSAQYSNKGGQKIPTSKSGQTGTVYYVSKYSWHVDEVKLKDALDGIYDYCISMGADALVNLQLQPSKKEYSGIKNPVVIDGYEISGFAIKRK